MLFEEPVGGVCGDGAGIGVGVDVEVAKGSGREAAFSLATGPSNAAVLHAATTIVVTIASAKTRITFTATPPHCPSGAKPSGSASAVVSNAPSSSAASTFTDTQPDQGTL